MANRRALLSVSDKAGITDLARSLAEMDFELVSTGGTAKGIRDAGVSVIDVSEVTGFPEGLNGRLKTLHPMIHGGILADLKLVEHGEFLDEQGITPIELVICNLYPFGDSPSIDNIDIGGPTMLRAAAKNHDRVGVVIDPTDYLGVVEEIRKRGTLSAKTKRRLAKKAFGHTANYDRAIELWFHRSGE